MALVATAALSAAPAAGGTVPSNPPIPAGFVHQDGTQLLDGAGQPLKLRGVDLGGWLSWEGWMWGESMDYVGESAMMSNLTSLVGSARADQFQTEVYDNFITAADFEAMSEDGYNVARVPFNYRMLEDDSNPGVYKQSGWEVLDQLVAEAKANNVYLVLDMHVAPCSQTLGFTADYVGGPDLWGSEACQERMVALWKAIAARYATDNVIAGYDLLNEPVASNQQLISLYQRVTAAIRQVDPNHLIIYEGNDLAREFSGFTAPLDSNEMFEFHDYSWTSTQDITTRMPGYNAVAERLDSPIWCGEFGQDLYSGIAHYTSTFNQDPLVAGWADWTWKQSPGFPALQTIQESPDAAMLIDWIDNTSRPEPTLAQAEQGMSDFIEDIQFANTVPNPQMQQALNLDPEGASSGSGSSGSLSGSSGTPSGSSSGTPSGSSSGTPSGSSSGSDAATVEPATNTPTAATSDDPLHSWTSGAAKPRTRRSRQVRRHRHDRRAQHTRAPRH